jgi:hypothetical protein
MPTTRWQEPLEAPLTDVFRVQADIAGRVAEALNVALGSRARQRLSEGPTANIAAYDAYLRGEEISGDMASNPNPVTLRRALPYYEQAVALDSGFVEAWALGPSPAGPVLSRLREPAQTLTHGRAKSAKSGTKPAKFQHRVTRTRVNGCKLLDSGAWWPLWIRRVLEGTGHEPAAVATRTCVPICVQTQRN